MVNRSPFPGMDPWLESQWGDLHHGIVQYSRDLIADQLPRGLFAAVEETVYVLDQDGKVGRIRPDSAIFERSSDFDSASSDAGEVLVTDPVRIAIGEQRVSEGHIEIRRIGGGEPLVTAIEVISATNKKDARGRKAYIRKRETYYEAGAAVVEIDLLRAGEPVIDVPWDRVKPAQLTPYRAAIRRGLAEVDAEVEYYPLSLRQRLPRIAIPLRPIDKDVILDLQAPINLAYEKGRYGMRIDYSKPPDPPLSAEDAAWAATVISTRSQSE